MRLSLIILLLIPSLCFAGPSARRMMTVSNCNPHTSINCIYEISDTTVNDTMTETKTMGAGDITADFACTSTAGNSVAVFLYSDGLLEYTLSCGSAGETKSATASYTVTAGSHSVQIRATSTGGGSTFSANNFSIPIP
jgi:hypothetical protein